MANAFDAHKAHKLLSGFFAQEWAKTDVSSLRVKRITGGLINTINLVSRDTTAAAEPAAVIVRHFGLEGYQEEPPGDSITLSAAQQAVVCWEMSRRGLGPKIYGFFPGGRLEEYIDSHTLTAAESTEADIRRDVARSYARLHSLQLPLRRDSFSMVGRDFIVSMKNKQKAAAQELQAIDDTVARDYFLLFQETDWVQELQWVSDLFAKHNCKMTITQGDTNYLNILVKNYDSECRVMLIDYETVCFSYRGSDIGGHFNERMYRYSQPDTHLTGFSAPNAQEQREFCEAYLHELRFLGCEMTEYDTVDHLMLEASIGRMYQLLFTNFMSTVFDEVEVEPLFLSGLLHMMQMYAQVKREFERSYAEAGAT
ncbi:hypothetical protein LTR62_005327 [Meristemomyces frigidus]|uniref:Choline kinase n=1 Tax=Meristemomyces frigidus TaxID=1508187 RepID=A0AAN7TDI0_9PEZI|nr:hypothetical protein LTR62_005327 [Meristemomyces frigidus]